MCVNMPELRCGYQFFHIASVPRIYNNKSEISNLSTSISTRHAELVEVPPLVPTRYCIFVRNKYPVGGILLLLAWRREVLTHRRRRWPRSSNSQSGASDMYNRRI